MGMSAGSLRKLSHVPILLILFICTSCTSSQPPRELSSSTNSNCAVIFDAGSSGSRVHVYCFDANMDLVNFGDGYELFQKTSPGLSSYAADPEKGAESIKPLLNAALSVVPTNQRAETPVRLGATAGLRLLPGESAANLLKAVSNLLKESSFKFKSQWVSILDGSQEGRFSWVSINYLLGKLGQDFGKTVATVDLGGGSVQMSYAISNDAASNAHKAIKEVDDYITTTSLLGKEYNVYVHSYLGYGLLAGRAEVLKLTNKSKSSPCVARGFEGTYVYDSVTYKAVGPARGANFSKCQGLILKALDISATCNNSPCTFGGIWSGGGGDGQKSLYVASFFFDRAMEAGIITNPNATEAKVSPEDFAKLARRVCKLDVERIAKFYPSLDEEDRPYFCLDLTYEYALLVEGFGLHKRQVLTLVKQVTYRNAIVEAQWTLGCAIDVLSSSTTA
ncbi:hypothetical protein L7F22_068917 [Adiantum nelumboides]|nr:hypothetical protein [Adiantum nelumboides]